MAYRLDPAAIKPIYVVESSPKDGGTQGIIYEELMMPMLFNPNRIDAAPPRFAESLYVRMNRLPDEHLVACRADLEDWFTRYPLEEQPETGQPISQSR